MVLVRYNEYYENGNNRREYYKLNSNFINEYKEYYPDGQIYREALWDFNNKVRFNIYDENPG